MITKIQEKSSLSGVKSPLLPLIYSDFLFPKNECDGAFFQTVNCENTLLLSLKGGSVNVIKLSDNYDVKELEAFFSFSHIKNIVSDFKINGCFKKFNLYCTDKVMFAEGDYLQLNGGSTTEAFKGVYSLLNEGEGDFTLWYPDFTRRLNGGVAKGVYLTCSNTVVSCAVCPALWGESAVIGGVATHKEYGNKGYGSLCVKALVNLLFKCNVKNIYLWCSNENCGFYEKIGFCKIGNIYISEEF